ncbi:MAG: tetratricopeptide repeat protein [Chthoniobacterales bacterium]
MNAAQVGKRCAAIDRVEFEWNVQAACGYAELGMYKESIAELDAIEDRFQNRPEVLQLRLHHLMREKRWGKALRVSQLLCRVAPDCDTGFLHAGFCLHQLGKTAETKKLLVKGPVALLKEPIYYYNMGCYEALLGDVNGARENLLISFRMDSSFRELAKKDPDLQAVHALI